MGMWEHLRIFPLGIRPEGSSAGGDPSNVHREIKTQSFTVILH
jgi:hypothetical protein